MRILVANYGARRYRVLGEEQVAGAVVVMTRGARREARGPPALGTKGTRHFNINDINIG